MRSKAIYAPIMGGTVSLVIFIIYLLTTVPFQIDTIFDHLLALLNIIPILYFVLLLISYFFSLTVGLVIIRIKEKYLLTTNLFWLISFITASVIGMGLAVFNYYLEGSWSKAIVILLSFSFGGVFTASLYSVIKEEVKKN